MKRLTLGALLALTLGCEPVPSPTAMTPTTLASRIKAKESVWLRELKTSASSIVGLHATAL